MEEDQFKSFGERSGSIDLLHSANSTVVTVQSTQKKLFAAYQHNLSKKKQLQEQIKKVEEAQRVKKQIAQYTLDSKREKHMIEIIDSDDQFEPDYNYSTMIKEFQRKKDELRNLECRYMECQKITARLFIEKWLNDNIGIRGELPKWFSLSFCLFIQELQLIAYAIHPTQQPDRCTIMFRSVGVPKKRESVIKINRPVTLLNYANNFLLVGCQDYFHVYDFESKKLLAVSSQHESSIVYLNRLSDILILSVTTNNIVRVYNLSKLKLESLLVCQGATMYHLHDDILYFNNDKTLNSVNVTTKEYKTVTTLDSRIIQLSSNTIKTAEYYISGWLKGQYGNRQPQQQITVGKDTVRVVDDRIKYKDKEFMAPKDKYNIGYCLKSVMDNDGAEVTAVVSLWVNKFGEFQEMCLFE